MKRGNSNLDREGLPFSREEIEGAARVFEQLTSRPRLMKELQPEPAQLVKLAKRIRAVRERRSAAFGAQIFGEPGWDILLSLFIAQVEEYRMKISAACNESGVPSTTALRWIDCLVEHGLVRKINNPLDARSRYVQLTAEGAEKMGKFLSAMWVEYFPLD